MFKQERTCICTKDCTYPGNTDNKLNFHKGREYQVDVFALYYQVYQNGGWYDYVYLNEEEFNNNFKLIE